ncbi:MAG: YcgN family cysteine cluster protein [Halioglobus sp.]
MSEWWNDKELDQLSSDQWELLCDGCAKCCLHKLQDEETGEVYYTSVRCHLLVEQSCRCGDYANRAIRVPMCIDLRATDVSGFDWLPSTCAYRLRAKSKPLPEWHPLVTGSADSVHQANASIRGRTVSDEFVHPDGFEEHIVHWVK